MQVEAEITFEGGGTVKPQYFMSEGGAPPQRSGAFVTHRVAIGDARRLDPAPDMDRNGFMLLTHSSQLPQRPTEAQLRGIGYAEVRDILQGVLGPAEVHIFDHTRRSSAPKGDTRGTARHAHNDYTETSALQKLDELGVVRQGRRVMQVNLWRSIAGPVLRAPLGIVDGASIPPEDLIACDLLYPDRKGEIYELRHNARHRWYYYPRMTRDEVVLFKGYDSETDGVVRYAPHSAFTHPGEHDGLPARISVEFRTLVLM